MVKKPSIVIIASVAVSAALSLAGCGDADRVVATSTTATTAAPTTLTPTPTTAPTTTSPAANPDVPKVARAHTPAGAEAFVRYFYAQLNLSKRSPQVGLISRLSLPTCKTCARFEGFTADAVKTGVRLDGDLMLTQSADATTVSDNGDQPVYYVGLQKVVNVLNAQGKNVDTSKAATIKSEATLHWTQSGWAVATIKDVK